MLAQLLLPLPTSVIDPSELKEQYYPVVQHDIIYQGAIYAVPMGFDTLALFTNSDIFTAAGASVPQTWNDFNDVARLLTVQEKETSRIITSGAALGNTENVNHATDIISLLFLQNGANLYNLSQSKQDVSEALQFYTNFQPDVWNSSLDTSLLAFSKGNLAMYIGYSWDIFPIKAQNPSLNFEVHPMPNLADRKMTVANYWVEGGSSASKHKKEIMVFLAYLAKKQTQQKFYDIASKNRLFGQPFPRRDLAERLKSNQLTAPFVTQGDIAQPSYFISDIAENGVNAQANTSLTDGLKNMGIGFNSADDVADKLIPEVTAILSRYGYQ
jgi:multiple sugar transport system substrate-binding protein